MIKRPHYLLLSEARRRREPAGDVVGSWRFVLESTDGTDRLDITDEEADISGERLELLTVVRGLEALDQPSRVTLITPSRYVHRGLRYGLPHWRREAWTWEHDGRMIPISNVDLWQRMDHALQYHELQCRWFRVDGAEVAAERQVNVRPSAGSLRWWPMLRRWFQRATRSGGSRSWRQSAVARPKWVWRPVAATVFCRPIGASA